MLKLACTWGDVSVESCAENVVMLTFVKVSLLMRQASASVLDDKARPTPLLKSVVL